MHNIKDLLYNFTATWCKGSINVAPDALSHYLICELSQEDMLAEQDEEQNPATSISELMSTAQLRLVREYAPAATVSMPCRMKHVNS